MFSHSELKNPGLQFKSMYIVVSVHPNDRDCCDTGGKSILII